MNEPFRIGMGYDIHRLVEGRPLVLGGVEIPFEKGLLGHSDSDVLAHAIADAMIGAVALGDIGTHFPDTDPQYKGISSLELLTRVTDLIEEHGLQLANLDSVILAERPRLAPHIPDMRRQLASAFKVAAERVSVKAKTGEGLDAVGRGEAMAAQAVVLLRKKESD